LKINKFNFSFTNFTKPNTFLFTKETLFWKESINQKIIKFFDNFKF